MTSTYKVNKSFSANELRQIIKDTGLPMSPNKYSNASEIASHLKSYNGKIDVKSIVKFIRSNKQTKQVIDEDNDVDSKAADIVDKEFNRLYDIDLPMSSHRSIKPLIRRMLYLISVEDAAEQLNKAFDAIDNLNKDNDNSEPVKLDLTSVTPNGKHLIERNLGKLLYDLASKVNLNTQIIITYTFKGKDGVKSVIKTLNENNVNALLSQLKKEHLISDLEAEQAGVVEQDYDMFPDKLRNLTSISFKNITKKVTSKGPGQATSPKKDLNVDELLKYLTMEQINMLRGSMAKESKDNSVIEGGFWKYYVNLPIDLTRYQIVNSLSEENGKIISRDSCLVYAMIQAGVDDDVINEARSLIRTRTMPQSKLADLSVLIGVDFKVTVVYLDADFNRTTTHDKVYTYYCGRQPKYFVDLLLVNGHYMLNEKVPITTYYIENYDKIKDVVPLEEQPRVCYINGSSYRLTKDKTSLVNILIAIYKNGYAIPITHGDLLSYKYLNEYQLPDFSSLDFDVSTCCKLIVDQESKSEEFTPKDCKAAAYGDVLYADYEASTDGEAHKEYMICVCSRDNKLNRTFYGNNCTVEFLDVLKHNSLVYFHNLSYDINFIVKYVKVIGQPIMKSGRVLSMTVKYVNKFYVEGKHSKAMQYKTIMFKDSYAIISIALRAFPAMFNLKSGDKEVFPYNYYNKTILEDGNRVGNIEEACKHLKPEDVEHFKQNIEEIPRCKLSDTEFDLMVYSKYYCMQDVNILLQGFEKFRNDMIKEFGLDTYKYLSNSSLAYDYMNKNCYAKNGNIYLLSGKPREFISRCVQGGRCMTKDNEKQMFISDGNTSISDFDAVSLYPSAINRLYLLEGIPKVLSSEMLSTEYLLSHLFNEGQSKPTAERFISGFYVLVHIDSIGIKRHMPLIVVDPKIPGNKGLKAARSSNTCCYMYVDHIAFQDLIEFQQCKLTVIEGYYYNDNRDYSCQDVIANLFNLRLKYKKEGNSLQSNIKLILNSIYGKCLLKPIEKQVYIKSAKDTENFIRKHYNRIDSIETVYGNDSSVIKVMKPIHKHFNLITFGVNILSMSKRIMNEVFCTAEDNNIEIFYQDTDSGHYYTHQLTRLAELFEAKYHRPLIGTALGQFHSDFAEVVKGKTSYATRSVFVGKKTYIDQLEANGVVNFHCRMKGITQEVISIVANERHPQAVQCYYDSSKGLHVPVGPYDAQCKFSVMELYEELYNGVTVTFDLCKGNAPCFDRKNNFSITTKTSFIRKLKF